MTGTARLLAAALFVPTAADAASRTALNRCSDAVTLLRQQGTMTYQDEEVNPLQLDKAKRHLAQVQETFGRAMAQLKQIPKGELDKNDPELKECWATFSSWGEYKELVQAKLQRATEFSTKLVPFLQLAKPHEDAFYRLAALEVDPAADALGQTTPEQARAMLAGLAEVEKACAVFGADVGNDPLDDTHKPAGGLRRVADVSFHDGFNERPNNWCRVAKRRTELMTAAAGNRFVPVEGSGNYAVEVPEVLKRYSLERPDLEAWLVEVLKDKAGFVKRRDAEARAWNSAVGVKPAVGSGLAAQLDALQKKVDEVAARSPAPATGYHDAALEAAAKAALKAIFSDASVKASMMQDTGWTIEKNALGIPLERYRLGYVVFKRAAFKSCEQRSFQYTEPHQGGGSYAQGRAAVQSQVRFVGCP